MFYIMHISGIEFEHNMTGISVLQFSNAAWPFNFCMGVSNIAGVLQTKKGSTTINCDSAYCDAFVINKRKCGCEPINESH